MQIEVNKSRMRKAKILLVSILRMGKAGVSLVELLIAMGLISVVFIIVMLVSSLATQESQNAALKVARGQILEELRFEGGKFGALRQALAKSENQEFRNCVCGGAPCTSMKLQELFFFPEPGGANMLSRAFFDSSGMPCDGSPRCFIQVTASFLGQCKPTLPAANPLPPIDCLVPAEFVEVIFSVEQNPASLADGTALFQPIEMGVYLQTEELAPAGSGACP